MNERNDLAARLPEFVPSHPQAGGPTMTERCWKDRFSLSREQCVKGGVWRSTAPMTEMMVFCEQHAPPAREGRVRVEAIREVLDGPLAPDWHQPWPDATDGDTDD